jgi:hypothetical protein
MGTFFSRMRTVLVVLYRCSLFVLAAVALVLLYLSAWLERFLRKAVPLVLAALPPHYRRLLLWMPAPAALGNTIIENAAAE